MVLSGGGLVMASSAVSELVLFIASLIIASIVAGGLYMVTQDISNGINVRGRDLAYNLRVNFEIINDPENIPVSGGAYLFYVKNIGEVPFVFDNTSVVVFIDGNMIPPANLTFTNLDNSGSNQLYPYDVGEIQVNTTLSSGYHKITVVIQTGKRKSLIFKVG